MLIWDRRRRQRWCRASFDWDRTRRRKPPSPGLPSRPCAGRDRNWDRVSTSCALLLLGHVHLNKQSPRMRPQPQELYHWARLLKAILCRTDRVGQLKKSQCGNLPPRLVLIVEYSIACLGQVNATAAPHATDIIAPLDCRRPGQMAGANPAVRPIVWSYGIAQFCPYLQWIGVAHDRSTRPLGPILERSGRARGGCEKRCRRNPPCTRAAYHGHGMAVRHCRHLRAVAAAEGWF